MTLIKSIFLGKITQKEIHYHVSSAYYHIVDGC